MYPSGGQHGPVGPYQQPPYQQPTWAGSGVGRLVIEAKCSWLVLMQRLLGRPEFTLNGSSIPGRWGVNTFDLREGEHEVQVVTNYVFSYVATTYAIVSVRAGQQTHLYYKAPVFVRRAGALDANPKGYPGMGLVITGYASAAVVVVGLAAYVLYLTLTS
jgi:hypothetical protein